MFGRWRKERQEKQQAYLLYRKLANQARVPAFYTDLAVEDNFDGRFDMILLHLFLLQNRLDAEGEGTVSLCRRVQEAMVSDLDRALRELGVGDMSIGKEMKKMGSAWFGRRQAYAAALRADSAAGALEESIRRNVYRDKPVEAKTLAAMVAYVQAAAKSLAACSLDDIKAVSFDYPAPGK
ncbi:MAG: hypothetical protein EP335_18605 [Alphaproteobacteria bacterium]|nr:MAG: hypothetical protein EP335_18605 [Alphaproteobacteria bacterium]